MAQSASLNDLFRRLHADARKEELERLIKTADQILEIAPKDADASQNKAVALIKQSDFKSALELLGPAPSFERAYALYRVNQYSECLQVLSAVPVSEGVQQLEAQVNYRLGNFARCIEVYEKLASQVENDHELIANMIAAYTAAGQQDKALALAKAKAVGANDTYEIAYNIACAHLESQNLSEAALTLKRAKALCLKFLEEEQCPPEEVKDETAVLLVQAAYVQQLQGDLDGAFEVYHSILNDKPSDVSVLATASNNIVTLRKKDEKLFDSLKRIEKALKVPPEKLSNRQRSALQLNHCLLLFHGKKFDKCRELAESMQKEFPESATPALILAALYQREKQFGKAEEILQSFLSANPGSSPLVQLSLAHLKLLQNQQKAAIDIVKQIPSIQHQPSTVATLVALWSSEGADKNVAEAVKILDEATAFWQKRVDAEGKSSPAAKRLQLILESSAAFRLDNDMAVDALKIYQQLFKPAGASTPKAKDTGYDPVYLSKAVLASAKTDIETAARYAYLLPALPGLESVDVKALEAIAVPRVKSVVPTTDAEVKEFATYDPQALKKGTPDAIDFAATQKKKKKKKKKKRLPKNFDPANPGPPPDPERWLPRWDRSYNKKAKKARQRNQMKGAQGSSSAAAEKELDMSAGSAAASAFNSASTSAKASGKLPPPRGNKPKGGRRK